jgi:hypothetical protein
MTRSTEAVRDRVRTILEQQLATVDSPDRARAKVQKVLKAAGDASEADRSHENGQEPGSAADQLGRVARGRSGSDRVAALLVETAAQSLASTKDAQGVAEAAYDVLGPVRTGYLPPLNAADRCSGPPALTSCGDRTPWRDVRFWR